MANTTPRPTSTNRAHIDQKVFDLDVVAVGGDGAATGNSTTAFKVNGKFVGFKIPGSVPAGTTWKVEGVNTGIVYYDDVVNVTEGYVYPRTTLIDKDGGAITDSHEKFPIVDETIKVTVSLSNAGTYTVSVIFE